MEVGRWAFLKMAAPQITGYPLKLLYSSSTGSSHSSQVYTTSLSPLHSSVFLATLIQRSVSLTSAEHVEFECWHQADTCLVGVVAIGALVVFFVGHAELELGEVDVYLKIIDINSLDLHM